MTRIITFIFAISLFLNAYSQPENWKNKKYFTVVHYNVENLFDTVDTPSKSDSEFTPQSKKQWNTKRYNKKLTDIAKVISSINSKELPEIIGLTELENISVLNDLVKEPTLAAANYKPLLIEGPDPRGIDCGLLYRPDVFNYISHEAIIVRFPFAKNQRTRDILYVKGTVNKDTVHFFVNHWSSRRGGEKESEIKRVTCATVLKTHVDSIRSQDETANIIIMGDFNDEPSNKSLDIVLDAGTPAQNRDFTNLMYDQHNQGKGSYYYRGKFNMLDNFIVSKPLISKSKGFRLYEPTAYIYEPDFLVYKNKNGDLSPSKTYGGKNYYGGYSDHFLIYTILYEK